MNINLGKTSVPSLGGSQKQSIKSDDTNSKYENKAN